MIGRHPSGGLPSVAVAVREASAGFQQDAAVSIGLYTELGAREHGRVILESACGPQHGVPRLLAPLGQLVLAMLCSIGREKLLQSRSSWSRRRNYLFMAVREAPSLRFQRPQR